MIVMTAHCDLHSCGAHAPTDPEGIDVPAGWVTVAEASSEGGKRQEDENHFCSRDHARQWLNGTG